MPEPFKGFDPAHLYTKFGGRGDTGKASFWAPKELFYLLEQIRDSKQWPFKNNSEVWVHCAYIGMQTCLEVIDAGKPNATNSLLQMGAKLRALDFQREIFDSSSEDLLRRWSMARDDQERALIADETRVVVEYYSPDVQERLTRTMGL